MRYSLIIIFFAFVNLSALSQKDTVVFDSFLVIFNDNFISIEKENNLILYQKQFTKPYHYTVDINGDSKLELIVVDSVFSNGKINFYFYLYSVRDKFTLIDSIFSGAYYPFLSYAEEISSIIIQTGNPEFEIFNKTEHTSLLPINVWKLEDDKILLVNDEVYEPFLFENENLIRLLNFYLVDSTFECKDLMNYKGIIASAYTNYILAGELSLSENFFNKYYNCNDKMGFKKQILDLIFPEAK